MTAAEELERRRVLGALGLAMTSDIVFTRRGAAGRDGAVEAVFGKLACDGGAAGRGLGTRRPAAMMSVFGFSAETD